MIAILSGILQGAARRRVIPEDPGGEDPPPDLTGPESLVLGWEDYSSDEDGFRVEFSLDEGANWYPKTVPPSPSEDGETVEYIFTGLDVNTRCDFRVAAFRIGETTIYTDEVTLYTTPPNPPGNPQISMLEQTITLDCDAPVPFPVFGGVRIYKRNNVTGEYEKWMDVSESFPVTDSGLEPLTEYSYYMVSFNTNPGQEDEEGNQNPIYKESPRTAYLTITTGPEVIRPLIGSMSVDMTGLIYSVPVSETVEIGPGGPPTALVIGAGDREIVPVFDSIVNGNILRFIAPFPARADESIAMDIFNPPNGVQDLAGNDLLSTPVPETVRNDSHYGLGIRQGFEGLLSNGFGPDVGGVDGNTFWSKNGTPSLNSTHPALTSECAKLTSTNQGISAQFRTGYGISAALTECFARCDWAWDLPMTTKASRVFGLRSTSDSEIATGRIGRDGAISFYTAGVGISAPGATAFSITDPEVGYYWKIHFLKGGLCTLKVWPFFLEEPEEDSPEACVITQMHTGTSSAYRVKCHREDLAADGEVEGGNFFFDNIRVSIFDF